MGQPRCGAPTAKGTPCRRWAQYGSKRCKVHNSTTEEISKALRSRAQCNYTKRNGERCKKPPIHGTTVCDRHGGAARHIRVKAQARLDAMIMPAITELNRILLKPDTTDADRTRIGLAILDRTGFGRNSTLDVSVEVKPWEKTMEAILTEMPDDYVVDAEVIEDAEIVEESLAPVKDMSRNAQFDGPRIGPDTPRPARVRGSAEPPARRGPSYDY